MISEEKLQEFERLADEATKGPWYAYEGPDYSEISLNDGTTPRRETPLALVGSKHKDAAFIAAAREAVPALIEEVRELRESLKREAEHLTIIIKERVKLEKEADWLAENASECPYISGGSTFCWRHCPMWIGPRDRSGHCEKPDMREAARKATEGE